MAIPVTNTIVVQPGDFGDAGMGSQPNSTYAGLRIEIDPADAAPAFAAARDALPNNGGDIWVSPGTADYEFDSQVDWGTKSVSIEWSPGARAKYSSGVPGLFIFRRPCKVRGLLVRQDVVTAPSGQSILLVDDTAAANTAGDCEFIGCRFELLPTAAAIRDLVCIRAQGFDPANASGRILVDRCAMVLRSGGTQQTWSWVGEETSGVGTNELTGIPYGLGLVAVTSFRQAIVRNASIRGQAQGGSGQYAGVPVRFDDCLYSLCAGLTASDLSLRSVGSSGVLAATRKVIGTEGTHMNFSGGSLARVTAKSALAAVAPYWLSVGGLVVRDMPTMEQFLRSIQLGTSVFVRGNLVSKLGSSTARFCDLASIQSVSVVGNAVVDRQGDVDPFLFSSCSNVQCERNLVETRR